MKKFYNNKRYNTDSARAVGVRESTGDTADPKYVRETLYRKVTGEYFLHCFGNADSPYADYGPDGSSAAERIIPLSDVRARDWAKKFLPAEVYEEHFGGIRDDAPTQVGFVLTASEARALKAYAARKGTTQLAVLKEWISEIECI